MTVSELEYKDGPGINISLSSTFPEYYGLDRTHNHH